MVFFPFANARLLQLVTERLSHGKDNHSFSLRVGLHHAVVRELKAIGKPSNGSFDQAVEIPTHPDWNAQELRVVVFVQDFSEEILGAAATPYQHALVS